jgi:hypothetical protein
VEAAAREQAKAIIGTVFQNTGASHETLEATVIGRVTNYLATRFPPTEAAIPAGEASRSEQHVHDLKYASALARQIARDFFYDEDFQSVGGMAGILASISSMLAHVHSLVYLGEHHHPDLTWKARCLEANDDLNKARSEIERLNAEVAQLKDELKHAEQRRIDLVDDYQARLATAERRRITARADAIDEAIGVVQPLRRESDTGGAYESGYNFAIGDAVEELEAMKQKDDGGRSG